MEGTADVRSGERMDKMVQALDKATEKTLSSCTLKMFLGCYPPELTSKHEDIFTAAHTQFLRILQTNIKDELAIVNDRYDVDAKLQLIDQWKENQLAREIAGQSLAPLEASPRELAAALVVENKRKEKEKLLQALHELGQQRERLQREREEKNERMQTLTKQVEENTKHIEKAVAVGRNWAQSDAREWQSKEETH